MSLRVVMDRDAEAKLHKDLQTARALRVVANTVKSRVHLPKEPLTLSVQAGVGPHGAFAQVVMRGKDAVFFEFGSKTRRALAPLRSALRGRL